MRAIRHSFKVMTYDIDFAGVVSNIVYVRWLEDLRNLFATKLMRWSWKLTDAQRGGLTSRQFIRLQLMRLQLGEDLTHLKYGNMPRRIASAEEVLAVRPELRDQG